MMKRIFALLLCAATLLTSLAFVGCDDEDKKEKEEEKREKGTVLFSLLKNLCKEIIYGTSNFTCRC